MIRYFTQLWSARKAENGLWEPDKPISGIGINYKDASDDLEKKAMSRIYMEDSGRIEKGAPYFSVNAPFVLIED